MRKGNFVYQRFIALILNALRIKKRLQNDYICTLKM